MIFPYRAVLLVLLVVLACGCVREGAPPSVIEASTTVAPSTIDAAETTVKEADDEPAIERGTADPDLILETYKPEKASPGTTLLPDNHNPDKPRVIEVNLLGEILWEYDLPENLKEYTNPGFDVEPLTEGNILIVLPRKGVYEINREGETVWSYLDSKVSHDADRLPNGNTLIVYGNNDQTTDSQVKEINREGEIVWTWQARDRFYDEYKDVNDQGWTHTNAAIRMENGNTLISPRNFNMLVEVDPKGEVIRTIGGSYLKRQHDPEILDNGNILLANHDTPHEILELNPETDEIIWRYTISDQKMWPVRDANRLDNGNTLITGATAILEVTPDKETVWKLKLKGGLFQAKQAAERGFYKAERIPPNP
ncbi:MAG: aryl-sulfate sulfotransferase [Candidatus Altiarchaeota archaeon]